MDREKVVEMNETNLKSNDRVFFSQTNLFLLFYLCAKIAIVQVYYARDQLLDWSDAESKGKKFLFLFSKIPL